MNELLVAIVSGLLVLLIGWGAKVLFLSRRLYLVKPTLFDYTELTGPKNAKTIELTVLNAGAKSEEDIKVQLSPNFNYTILASNTSGLSVDSNGVMALSRLAPKQDMTVILIAEGGDFRKEHVMGISSKDVVGKIKESITDAKVTPAQSAFVLFVIFVLVPAFSFLFGRFVEREIWPEVSLSFMSGSEVEYSLGELQVSAQYGQPSAAKVYSNLFSIEKVSRVGDALEVVVKLENPTEKRINFMLSTSTSASDKRPAGMEYIKSDILVFEKSEKEILMSDYLPSDASPKILMLEIRVDGALGDVRFTRDLIVK